MFSGELTDTVVPCTNTVVVCIDEGGGIPDKHGAQKVVLQVRF